MTGASERNVERVRRGYAAFASGDIETVRAFLDPKVTFEEGESTLDTPAIYHGPDGLLEMFVTVNEGVEDVRYQPGRFIAAGDRVLVEVRRTGRGSSSRAPVERQQFHAWEVADRREASAETAAADP
jgi:ketosteroid isomerase-like protein